jgi:hypothetical protein
MFDLGFEGHYVRALVLGNAPFPGGAIVSQMRSAGVDVTWFSAQAQSDYHYHELNRHFRNFGSGYDLIIIAEHSHPDLLIGSGGYLDFECICEVSPHIALGMIAGNIDIKGLIASGLYYLPTNLAPFGLLSYQPYELGPRPVLQLFSAGLKVGESMARARLFGLGPKESADYALNNSPAMDFSGEMAWR